MALHWVQLSLRACLSLMHLMKLVANRCSAKLCKAFWIHQSLYTCSTEHSGRIQGSNFYLWSAHHAHIHVSPLF